MSISIALNGEDIDTLNLSPASKLVETWIAEGAIASLEQQVSFAIDYPRAPEDPRELSEIPEIRLWFVRFDARYPWFFFLLDGKSGELYRYTAMLVPHQFNRSEGIQYNPEALEIFVMHKIFVLSDWLQQQGLFSPTKLKAIAQTLGYALDESFFALLEKGRAQFKP